ncbi:MAG: universal stress protein [Granulosicoccus sp.]|nr:universal stress protein [Granulosicoccus sp.]
MFKSILVPVALDHTRNVNAALDIARRLLEEGGTIIALNVIEAIPGYAAVHLPANYQEKGRSEARAALQAELGEASDIKLDVVTGHAGRTILNYAEQHDCQCIVVASHRPGLQDYFLGSTAAWVVRHAGCSVHVVR